MTSIKEKFDNMIAEQKKIKEEFQSAGQAITKEAFKEFFDLNPGITAVIWTQYTPYFNDGDACEFRVNDPTFTNASEDELENVNWGEYEGKDKSVWACEGAISRVLSGHHEWHKELAEQILNAGGVDVASCDVVESMFASSEMEDIFETLFGDHVKITATRKGFDIDEYEHD
jgi:hypothetical protein